MDRFFFFGVIFVLCCHFGTCFWLICASIDGDEQFKGTWLERYYLEYGDHEDSLYVVAFYWTITTITTVGYGDIVGTNTLERIFCSFVMIIGVISFSFAQGSIASILATHDAMNGEYNDKMKILNEANKDYNLPRELYISLLRQIKYESGKTLNDLNKFVEELP